MTEDKEADVNDVLPAERVVINPAAAQEPAANTDAVATLALSAGRTWNLGAIYWSYSGAPTTTGPHIVISWTDAGNVARTMHFYVTSGGPGFLLWPDSAPLTMPADVAPTIKLVAGGAGITGTIHYMAKKG